MKLFLIAGILIYSISNVYAGATLIGPHKQSCQSMRGNVEAIQHNVMWVAGFLSAANRLQKTDVLVGKSISDVVDEVKVICLSSPHKDIETVTIEVVATFRKKWADENRSQETAPVNLSTEEIALRARIGYKKAKNFAELEGVNAWCHSNVIALTFKERDYLLVSAKQYIEQNNNKDANEFLERLDQLKKLSINLANLVCDDEEFDESLRKLRRKAGSRKVK